MERYFFHLQHARLIRDEEGTQLNDIQAAKSHAVQSLIEHLCHRPQDFWESDTYEVRVTDSADLTLLVISVMATLSPALAVTTLPAAG